MGASLVTLVMAIGEKFWINKVRYRSVVSQNKINWILKYYMTASPLLRIQVNTLSHKLIIVVYGLPFRNGYSFLGSKVLAVYNRMNQSCIIRNSEQISTINTITALMVYTCVPETQVDHKCSTSKVFLFFIPSKITKKIIRWNEIDTLDKLFQNIGLVLNCHSSQSFFFTLRVQFRKVIKAWK